MQRLGAAIVAAALLAALEGAAFAQDGPVMKRIAETKTITIGHRDASVPLSYLGSDGKAQGYSIRHLPQDRRRRKGGAQARQA